MYELINMTGQMSDDFLYQNEKYVLAGVSGTGLFNPEDYDMFPYSSCTACWRGYLVSYAIVNDKLVVQTLDVNLRETKKLNGKKPKKGKDHFKFTYPKLNLELDFTGTLMIAKDFIREMYVHMGFQRPMTYRRVYELKFENGRFISERDLSEAMAERRKENPTLDATPKSPHDTDVKNWISDTFSLEYESDENEQIS